MMKAKWTSYKMVQEDMKDPIFVPELIDGEQGAMANALGAVGSEMAVKGYTVGYENDSYAKVDSTATLVYQTFIIKLANGVTRFLNGKVPQLKVEDVRAGLEALTSIEGVAVDSVTIK